MFFLMSTAGGIREIDLLVATFFFLKRFCLSFCQLQNTKYNCYENVQIFVISLIALND